MPLVIHYFLVCLLNMQLLVKHLSKVDFDEARDGGVPFDDVIFDVF